MYKKREEREIDMSVRTGRNRLKLFLSVNPKEIYICCLVYVT